MYKQLQIAIMEYEQECKRVLEENILKVNILKDLEDIDIPTIKGIIPYIPNSSCTKFFHYSHVNLQTNDNNVLDYIPYIKETSVFDIQHYKETTIYNTPYSEYNEILYYMVKNNDINKISNFFNIEKTALYKLYNTTKPQTEFFIDICKNFCSICKLFGCKIHPMYSETCFDDKLCYCYKIKNRPIGPSDKKYLELHSKDIMSILRRFNGDKCMTSYYILKKYNHIVSCKDLKGRIRKFKKYLKSFHNTKFIKKDVPSICLHKGECYKNKDCLCFRNGTGCDEKCLCKNCDFLCVGCKCNGICSQKCKCTLLNRSCGNRCTCKGCFNLRITKTNLYFLSLNNKSTYVYKSKKSGLGCFANENIKKDDFVIEYIGEIISIDESNRRGNFYDINGLSYIFEFTSRFCIDANYIGNNSRFINHSSVPNLYIKTVEYERQLRLCLFALFDIKTGEELFFDYGYTKENKIKFNLIYILNY